MRSWARATLVAALVLMVVAVLFAGTGTASALEEGGYTYYISGSPGEATITGYTGPGGDIAVPATLGGFPVTTIAAYAFANNANISAITLPSDLLYIQTAAFYQAHITSAYIPASVSSISDDAFHGCYFLSSITVDPTNTVYCSIDGVLYNEAVTTLIKGPATKTGTLVIPETVTHINGYAFDHTSLTTVIITDNVTNVEGRAFAESSTLTTVVLGRNVTSIGPMAFAVSYNLKNITFLGLTPPTLIGDNWIANTAAGLRGHAYRASDFPAPGGDFNGLTMGAAIDATVPAAPYGLTAAVGNGQVALNWTAPDNGGALIDHYIVYQDGVALPTVSGLEVTITGLTNGQTYAFKVAAHNEIGYGPNSTETQAMPCSPPSAPLGVTATDGDRRTTINWTAPADDGGSVVEYYKVYMNGGPTPIIVNGLNIQFSGLVNGQAYFFVVVAHNIAGDGEPSAGIYAIPYTVPSAPTGLNAVPGDGRVTLSWSAGFNGGRSIDYYVVYQDGVALDTHPLMTSITITGLTNGQTYAFRVAAHNIAGLGPQTVVVTAKPFTVPAAPIGLSAAAGEGQVNLSWTAPSWNGYSTIDYYLVYMDGVLVPGEVVGTSTTVTGLTNGQSYTFEVAAHNAAGIGPLSNQATAIPFTEPDAPTGVQAVAGNSRVTINWTAPAFNGGRAVDYYVIYQNGNLLGGHYAGLNATILGLTNGESYTFTVAAHNLRGIGAVSGAASATPMTVPGAPRYLVATAANGQVHLAWDAPTIDGGSGIDYYIVYQDGVDVSHVNAMEATISGLTNGQGYTFAIAAHNAAGVGPLSNTNMATPFTVPGSPTDLVAVSGDDKVSLSWTAAANNGANINYYVVYRGGVDIAHVPTTYYNDSSVDNGMHYTYRVAAHNAAGVGPLSNEVSADPLGVPGRPTTITATGANGRVTLNWSAPADDGGSAIDRYVVYQDGVAVMNVTTTTATITGLINGQGYVFKVAAHNAVGEGAASVNVTGTPVATLPTAPLDPEVTLDDGAIVLSWSAPLDDGGSAVSYNIYRGVWPSTFLLIGTVEAGVLQYVDSNVAPGNSYEYYVTADNDVGEGPASETVGPAAAYFTTYFKFVTETVDPSNGPVTTLSGWLLITATGDGLAGVQVDLEHSTDGGLTWTALPSQTTAASGKFSVQVSLADMDIALFRAEYAGTAVYREAEAQISVAVMEAATGAYYTVQSSSTITEVLYRSSPTLFNVTVSEDGSSGYARIAISKSLVADASRLKVHIDGTEAQYQLATTGSSYVLEIAYQGGEHVLSVTQASGGSSDLGGLLPVIGIGAVAIIVVAAVSVLYLRKRRRG